MLEACLPGERRQRGPEEALQKFRDPLQWYPGAFLGVFERFHQWALAKPVDLVKLVQRLWRLVAYMS